MDMEEVCVCFWNVSNTYKIGTLKVLEEYFWFVWNLQLWMFWKDASILEKLNLFGRAL